MSQESVFEKLLVVELASALAGPAVGMLFAEMGSRVIKVEDPAMGNDATRSWRGPAERLGTVMADVLEYSREKMADLLAKGCVAAETGASQP